MLIILLRFAQTFYLGKQAQFASLKMVECWKLFKKRHGYPISLVHGRLLFDGSRTRLYALDVVHYAEAGTPGFNVFHTFEDLVAYGPRFKKSKNHMSACKVMCEHSRGQGPHYALYGRMLIKESEWKNRLLLSKVLEDANLQS